MIVEQRSTLASRESLRMSVARIESRLDLAAAEVSSGRRGDVGLALGAQSAELLDLRGLAGEIEAIVQSNGVLANRLSQTQSTLTAMVDLANGFFETLVASRQSGSDRGAVVSDARARLDTLTDLLSTTSNGAHLFSGDTTDAPPLGVYATNPPTGPRAAVHATFAAAFGLPPNDPQAAAISAPQMQTYLTGPFAALFQGPAWQTTFSSVGAGAVEFRASLHEVVTIPVDANSAGIRNLVSALVAVIDTGTEHLSADAYTQLIDAAASLTGKAGVALVRDQGAVGVLQERVTAADVRMGAQRGLIAKQIHAAEGVDLLEASSRLNGLMTQLEVSYAVTSRLQQMSILNYL